MLTANAKNLTSAISEALYYTQSASIRVADTTRKKLGLTDDMDLQEEHLILFKSKVSSM